MSVVLAQGAHAAIAAVVKNLDKTKTQLYLDQLDTMHKVVLKAESDEQLDELIANLKQSRVEHHVWLEQPENIRTCVATAPHDKALLSPLFRPFKLFN